MYDHDTDVGPVRSNGLPRHIRHGRDVEGAMAETQRVLHVHKNLERLTHQVPMEAIEDPP